MPPKKGKGKGKSSKESVVSRSPASESITACLKKAWREVDSLPFNKANIASQAAAHLRCHVLAEHNAYAY